MTRAPRTVGYARLIASLQACVAAAVAALEFLEAAFAWDVSRRARQGGFSNPFGRLSETVDVYLGCVALIVALIIAVPVVRLRRPRGSTRVWLTIVEGAVALACVLGARAQADAREPLTWALGVAPAIVAIVLLSGRSARAWTTSSGESLREVGQ